MMPFSTPPRWLPLHVLLGGYAASVLLPMTAPHGALAWWPSLPSGLASRCVFSLIVLVIALLLATTIGLAVGLVVKRAGSWAGHVAGLTGCTLACLPVVALVWGFAGVWAGQLGWPIETLMPAELPVEGEGWLTGLARILWEILAPVLILTVPLLGEVVQVIVDDVKTTANLDQALLARGIEPQERLWTHHLAQMLPLLRARLQALSLLAPVYLIVVEDGLRFMGWGGWMAQNLREGELHALSAGLWSGGVMMALLCGGWALLPGRLRVPRNGLTSPAWLPWTFWALVAMSFAPLSAFPWLTLVCALLLQGSAAWFRAWSVVKAQLPLEASRVLGGSKMFAWKKHRAVPQFRMLAAWIASAFAHALLWISIACAVQPRLVPQLAAPLAAWFERLVVDSPDDTARILANPSEILHAGGLLALAALCLIQVSRIVQPRPS